MSSKKSLLDIRLAVEPVDKTTFRNLGDLKVPGSEIGIYGGALVAQSLIAALKTIDNGQTPLKDSSNQFKPHSMHNYFLLGGDPKKELTYKVINIRDGKNFKTKQVHAIQNDKIIFISIISFRNYLVKDGEQYVLDNPFEKKLGKQLKYQPDFEKTVKTYGIKNQEDCTNNEEVYLTKLVPIRDNFLKEKNGAIDEEIKSSYLTDPMETRFPPNYFDLSTPKIYGKDQPVSERVCYYYSRIKPNTGKLNKTLDREVGLSYLSDQFFLLGLMPLNNRRFFSAFFSRSLDHSIYFCNEVEYDICDWLCFVISSSRSSGDGLSLMEGKIFNKDGRLVAVMVQEGLVTVDNRKSKL
ncbi:Thioesterase/thiol ester dehydrase-isomerase [Ascoidea rubescens DSM 1968]|uniref:Thioesterase/thiol ester dehydrase-isomerase n=1 Tax=Ascoidea rubescens DSM 1968 TaxID=1344418 RepID=A0A1D2VJM3_9ASCO|nr:Thioesterase/thiol ester dehydrase-isomerase [Ascoidea rubescens DSM 1968]ODV61824.1 Thioesterase/thiol ester dehydrase-isomerase [Ascoidea rubescens DSM 1968]